MSALVWLLMLYSAVTVTSLTVTEGIPVYLGMIYNMLVFMALASHAKTSLTDPGSVPLAAIPSERQRLMKDSHSMCGQCQTFKPPMSHHCRICNRCISRMDHHCPWMNNCVGANNLSKYRTPCCNHQKPRDSLAFLTLISSFFNPNFLTFTPTTTQNTSFSFSFTLGHALLTLCHCLGGTTFSALMRIAPFTQ